MKRLQTVLSQLTAALLMAAGLVFLATRVYAAGAQDVPTSALIKPEELAKVLQSAAPKPLILNVGPHFLYTQAHIPGAEYIGATADAPGLAKLRDRVKSLPRDSAIVIYCGCCPWEHCPNVRPAYKELLSLQFTRVRILYVGNTFGTDWVEKGYPIAKGG